MNVRVFSEAMGVVDNKYIEEAALYQKSREAFPWGKLSAVVACFAFALALALIIPTFIRQSRNSITENEPKVELTLEEAMNDKTFGILFPNKILKGYVLEDAPGIFGISDYAELKTADNAVLKAIFYNEELGDEMVIRIASKEWFYSHEKESTELNTIYYKESIENAGSYIYFEGDNYIVCYSFTQRDIAKIEGFWDMVDSAGTIYGVNGE